MSVQAVKPNPPSYTKGPDKREQGRQERTTQRSPTGRRVVLIFLPYKWQMILVLLAMLASTALNLVVPLMIPSIIDHALAQGDIRLLIIDGIIMSSAAVASGIIGVGQTYLSNLIGQQVMHDLRNKLYVHLQNLSLRFFTSMQTGEIQSRLSNDVGNAQAAVTDTFITLVTSLIVVCGTVVAMLYLNTWLTLISFIYLPIFLFFAIRVGNAQRKSIKAAQQSLAALSALMQETLSVSGILLIKTFASQQFAQSQFAMKNQKLMEQSLQQQMLGRWFFMFTNTFLTLIPVILYIVAGVLMIYLPGKIHITVGTLIAFVTVQGRFFGPFNQFCTALVSAQGSLALFDRIFEYLDLPIEMQDKPGAVSLPAEEVRGEVCFNRVTFVYEHKEDKKVSQLLQKVRLKNRKTRPSHIRKWVLEPLPRETLYDISFHIQPGQLVALVGPSGAGKTTIAYLVPRLYDVGSGSIEIDGYNVKDLALASLSQMVGTVTQEPYLFHTSVRENLLYARPEATEEEMIQAAKAAAIHDRIMELDNGYDTTVGERGYKLSGGEKQRVAIARVLLKNPKILILDEATSALDTASERLIQSALESLMKGRTTIAIAHRLSTVVAADLILVLDKGRIVERGTHQELLKQGGMYARLYNQQFAD